MRLLGAALAIGLGGLGVIACGDDDVITADGAGSGGESGSSGGGSSGEGGSGGGEPAPSPHVEAILACDVEEPCEGDAFAQIIEQGSPSAFSAGGFCVLEALAERRVGRYEYRTDHTFGNGATGAEHHLIVRADGTVAYVREPYIDVASSETPVSELLPPIEPLRCTLKPASYFEGCVTRLGEVTDDVGRVQFSGSDDAAEVWPCAFGDGDGDMVMVSTLSWFESCVSEEPLRCE